MIVNWLYQNLQRWTPFSVIATVAACASIGLIIYDSIAGVAIPAFLYAIITLVFGSTGATTLISHGVTVANGVASNTARSVVTEAVNQGVLTQPTGGSDVQK